MNHSIVVQELYQRLTRQSGSGPDEDKLVEGIITDIRGLVSLDKVREYIKSITDKMNTLTQKEADLQKRLDAALQASNVHQENFEKSLDENTNLKKKFEMTYKTLVDVQKDIDNHTKDHTNNVALIKKELDKVKEEKEKLSLQLATSEGELEIKKAEIEKLIKQLKSIRAETDSAKLREISV